MKRWVPWTGGRGWGGCRGEVRRKIGIVKAQTQRGEVAEAASAGHWTIHLKKHLLQPKWGGRTDLKKNPKPRKP